MVLHDEHLRPLGGGLGAGVIAILPDEACGVAEARGSLGYLAAEAAGQCGPCTNGLDAIAAAFSQIAHGQAPGDEGDVQRWSEIVHGRGACHHPNGAVRFATSALRVFADEFAEHRRRGPCPGCNAPAVLPVPIESGTFG